MNQRNIPVAASPPTQPATPPQREPLSAVEARNRATRYQALQLAVQYASAGGAPTPAIFWGTVAQFENYLTSGKVDQ